MGVLRQNDIWVQSPWPCMENNIRGRWWQTPSPGCAESCETYEFVHVYGLSMHQKCHDPNLGLVIKAKARKGIGQECNLGSTFALPRV